MQVILLLFLVAGFSPPSQAQDAQGIEKSCRNFVQQFYDWYVKRPEFPRALKYRRSAFSPELSRRLTEDNEAQAKTPGYIVGLDFDPFLNGQDPAEHYVVGRIKLTGVNTCWAEIHKGSSDKMSKATYVAAELVSNVGRWHFVNFYYSLANSDFSASVSHGGLLALLKDMRKARQKAANAPSSPEPTPPQTKIPPEKHSKPVGEPTPPKLALKRVNRCASESSAQGSIGLSKLSIAGSYCFHVGSHTVNQRTFLALALSFVLLAAVVGCRSSTKSAQATPPASGTPAAIVPTTVTTPTALQSEAAPLTDIKVAPPSSLFSPQQLPQDGNVRFLVPANAGDFLLMKVNEVVDPEKPPRAVMTRPHTVPKANYAISIGLPSKDPDAVKVVQKGGVCNDDSLYQLAQTGPYQVVFDTSEGRGKGYKYGISFALLAKDDPIVDPGIKPEQVSINFDTFTKGKHLEAVPAVLAEGCLDESWPSHLAVSNERIQFRVMQVAGYQKVFPSDQGVGLLEAAIAAGKTESVAGLPYARSDADLHMWARQQIVEGDGWRGLRWIGGYGQEVRCGPSELRYVFQGISNDGRFLILIRAAISHPAKQKRWASRCFGDDEVPKINALLAQDLTAADPSSFQPSLDQLDAVVRSLKLKQ